MDRIHRFEAIDNFRDFGGYAGAVGAVRPGRLFRSANHARASEADLDRLGALDIGLVVDLRRPSERRDQPSRRPTGFNAQVIESPHDDGREAPHITFLKSADLTETSGRDFMRRTYAAMPFDGPHRELFSRYFQALANTEGTAVIHCAAGKDRTGVLAALTHAALGVGRDDMIADYLLTNAAVDLERRAPGIAVQLERMTGRKASHAAVVAFLGVEADFLDAAFQAMIDRAGSIDGYLQGLGVDTALRDRLAERLAA